MAIFQNSFVVPLATKLGKMQVKNLNQFLIFYKQNIESKFVLFLIDQTLILHEKDSLFNMTAEDKPSQLLDFNSINDFAQMIVQLSSQLQFY